MNNPLGSGIVDEPTAPVAAHSASPPWRSVVAWLGIAFLFVLEYGLFSQYVSREIAWSIPAYHDQSVYLCKSHDVYETILSKGLWDGIAYGWKESGANGTQISLQAGLLYLFLGPSRLSALTLNFAYFLLLQAAVAGTLRWYTGRWSAAFVGIGLLLTANTTFVGAGGMMDFRIDFIAFCLYGTFICAAIRSDMFRSRPWSAGTGAVAALLVLFRFVTAPYVVGVLGLLFAAYCIRLWITRRNPLRSHAAVHQFGGLVLAGTIFSAFTLPAIALKWSAIKHYYIDHLFNGESQIRCQEYGYTEAFERLLYYPSSLFNYHAGAAFLVLSTAVLVAALSLGIAQVLTRRPNIAATRAFARPRPDGAFLLFAVLCVAVPLVVLTSWGSPSPVVGDVAVGGLLWTVLFATLWLMRLPRIGTSRIAECGLTAVAVASMVAGASFQMRCFSRQVHVGKEREALQQVAQMYDVIGQHSQQMHWKAPTLTHNMVSGTLYTSHANTVPYERRGIYLKATELLAMTIGPVSETDALAAIGKSDFVVFQKLTTTSVYPYPFNTCLRDLQPKLQAECERTHIALHRFRLFEDEVILYVRAAPEIRGATEDNWITSKGLTLVTPATVLRDRPTVELAGSFGCESPNGTPTVSAEVVAVGKPSRKVEALMVSRGARYKIEVKLKPEDIPDLPQVEIQLSFDGSPPCEALGRDPRQLLMRSPDEARLVRDRNEP